MSLYQNRFQGTLVGIIIFTVSPIKHSDVLKNRLKQNNIMYLTLVSLRNIRVFQLSLQFAHSIVIQLFLFPLLFISVEKNRQILAKSLTD